MHTGKTKLLTVINNYSKPLQGDFSVCQARRFRFRDKVAYSGEARRERAETAPA
jgi:hypothetical protein